VADKSFVLSACIPLVESGIFGLLSFFKRR